MEFSQEVRKILYFRHYVDIPFIIEQKIEKLTHTVDIFNGYFILYTDKSICMYLLFN